MVQIDNTKMWATILYYLEDYRGSSVSLPSIIKQALKDQGFKWDGEHIVPINPEPLKIEKGKWYMCINQFHNWIEGEIYTSIHDGRIIDYFGNEYDMQSDASEYFRAATEEEIEALRRNEHNVGQNPKFKVGDWVVWDGFYHLIQEISPDGYICEKGQIEFSDENNLHLWTIKDAKAGDVLADNVGVILFRKIGNDNWNDVVNYYCGCVKSRGNDVFDMQEDDQYWCCIEDCILLPATKEQHDLLFAKMKEAGYEWNADKLELEKIEQKPAEWSEEDKKMLDFAIRAIGLCKQYAINHQVNGYLKLPDVPKRYEELQDWLKFLRQKLSNVERIGKNWKPSEEQMRVLALSFGGVYKEEDIQILRGLFEQLKAL